MKTLKSGDLVRFTGKLPGFLPPHGTIGIIEEFRDEELISGRMCYLKVIIPTSGKSYYVSPGSVEIISESR